MKVVDMSRTPSVVGRFVGELRDVQIQGDRLRFRQNVVRIGHCMAYEVSKALEWEEREVQTPLSTATALLPQEDIVVATVFRAGLPLHQGFIDVFDRAGSAFVSAYRYYENREGTKVGVKIEYIASPRLEGKTLILVDPMLATGGSMELAYKAFLTHGTPKRLIMASVIAAKAGIDYLKKIFPSNDVLLYTAAIDPGLNEHQYIVPGLGDAGDLMYGEKV